VAFLAGLRILYGALNVVLVWLYHHHGMITRYYVEPRMHFTYPGFGWVSPWPGDGMYWHHAALAGLSVLVMVGLFYRVAILLLALGLAHVFLIEQARYLNHYYLNILVGVLLACMPAHRAWSVDARLRPRIRAGTVAVGTRWLLQVQIGLVYVYAGVAKLDGDWLRGLVLVRELRMKSELPIIGPLFATDWIAPVMSWGGLLLDLLVVPLLLWRRTRWVAFGAAATFHLANATLFRIDIFPWFMLGATFLLFFSDLLPDLGRDERKAVPRPTNESSASARGNEWWSLPTGRRRLNEWWSLPTGRRRLWVGLAVLYAVVQMVVPLRHHLYPGQANWTDHGHDFAWRMMLRAKTGHVREVTARYRTPDGRVITEAIGIPRDPGFWANHWQFRKMAQTPDMILQFCRWHAGELRRAGNTEVEIRADVVASLNGRPPQPLIDPGANLAACSRSPFRSHKWIVPLATPAPALSELLERLDAAPISSRE
jgi:hypothetical protein